MIYFIQDTQADVPETTVEIMAADCMSWILAEEDAGPGGRRKLLGVMDGDDDDASYILEKFRHLDYSEHELRLGPDLLEFIEANARQWSEEEEKADLTPILVSSEFARGIQESAEAAGMTVAQFASVHLSPGVASPLPSEARGEDFRRTVNARHARFHREAIEANESSDWDDDFEEEDDD